VHLEVDLEVDLESPNSSEAKCNTNPCGVAMPYGLQNDPKPTFFYRQKINSIRIFRYSSMFLVDYTLLTISFFLLEFSYIMPPYHTFLPILALLNPYIE
jgi:hypothetical protein